MPVCDNIRTHRRRLYPSEEPGANVATAGSFRGYIPSKRRYFYGLRLHLMVTGASGPVEFTLAAGSEADVKVFKELNLDLPEGSIVYTDKGYTDYDYEALLKEAAGLHLTGQRKKNSKRPMPAREEFLGEPIRQYIETVFSRLTSFFPRDQRGHVARLRA